jgi:hypothetical protein
MEENHLSIRNTGIKFGLVTALFCIMYFLIMCMAGFIQNTNLRFISYFILAGGIVFAYNEVKHNIHRHRLSYLPGIILGFVMAFITAITYAAFIFIYSRFIDVSFIPVVSRDLPFYNGGLNAYIIGICIFFEAWVVGSFIAFTVMQYFKRNRSNNHEAQDEAEEKGYQPGK